MSSAPIYGIILDQMGTTELANGTSAESLYLREARNRQWALQTGFGGTPFCTNVDLDSSGGDDECSIGLLCPPHVVYAWPGVFGIGDDNAHVKFTVTTYDPTIGVNIDVTTEETSNINHAKFFFSGGFPPNSVSAPPSAAQKGDAEGNPDDLAEPGWLKVGVAGSTWRTFNLTVAAKNGAKVSHILMFWYHQTQT